MRRTFNIISVIENDDIDFDDLTLTQHWSKQRMMRYQKILRVIGPGNLIASFIVDTAHLKGHEIHNVFSNGIILIQNEHSRKIVTGLIARPNQIKRYWK